jgi:hypothetical protein
MEVMFEPNPWVRESIWLLLDLMNMVVVMNASQLSAYDNIDGCISGLLHTPGLPRHLGHVQSQFRYGGPDVHCLLSLSEDLCCFLRECLFGWHCGSS